MGISKKDINVGFHCLLPFCNFVKAGLYKDKQKYRCVECDKTIIPTDEPIDFDNMDFALKQVSKDIDSFHLWYKSYQKLEAYYLANGHSVASRSSDVDVEERKIGDWLTIQRNNFEEDKLLPAQIHVLEKLEVILDKKKHRASIDQARSIDITDIAQEVIEFKRVKRRWPGDSDLVTLEGESRLAEYVSKWREAYRKGIIPEELISILNKSGFAWDLEQDNHDKFIRQAKRFVKSHGSLMPFIGTLKPWEVKFQNRLATRRKRPPTNAEILKDYDDLEMDWNLRNKNNRTLNYSTLTMVISLYSRNFNWDFLTHFIGATKNQIKKEIENNEVLAREMERATKTRKSVSL